MSVREPIQVGSRYSRLTVIADPKLIPYNNQRESFVLCRCDCGVTRLFRVATLRSGLAKSCGCLKNDVTAQRSYVHGFARTPIYHTWQAIMNRCYNQREARYKDYGGRGIRVCSQWFDPVRFIQDMSPKPPGASIDRIDNNGDYSPTNCRWATPVQQARNRRSNWILTVNGKTGCVAELASHFGVTAPAAYYRLRQGVPPEKAFKATTT